MEDSKIEWTDHTFNPWWGCMKISEGCKNCYAETLDNRYNHADPHWGPNSPRKSMSVAYWKQPLKWNEQAAKQGVIKKVFCASMADWAESQDTLKHYPSYLMVQDARLDLMQLIASTPNLIWQLLTKRPDNIMTVLDSLFGPLEMHDIFENGNKPYLERYMAAYEMMRKWLNGEPPANVWIGTSVENQKAADERIPHLLQISAKVKFLSCEPLLGPLDLFNMIGLCDNGESELSSNFRSFKGINWVICGGESGNGKDIRPMHPDWARSVRDQCKAACVPFFLKQWGQYLPACQSWPEAQINPVQFQSPNNPAKLNTYYKVGKHIAGAKLDGKEWKEFPA